MVIENVSQNFTTDKINPEKATIDDFIDVYEDRVFGWFIQYADKLRHDAHSGYAILSILLTLVEGQAIFLTGETSNNRSKEWFSKGLRDIFPEPKVTDESWKKLSNFLYDQLRCGLFHQGISKTNIIITTNLHGDKAFVIVIKEDKDTGEMMAAINPHTLIDGFSQYFQEYFKEIRNPKNAEKREKFLKGCNIIHSPE
jgi:hypothetical protein